MATTDTVAVVEVADTLAAAGGGADTTDGDIPSDNRGACTDAAVVALNGRGAEAADTGPDSGSDTDDTLVTVMIPVDTAVVCNAAADVVIVAVVEGVNIEVKLVAVVIGIE